MMEDLIDEIAKAETMLNDEDEKPKKKSKKNGGNRMLARGRDEEG